MTSVVSLTRWEAAMYSGPTEVIWLTPGRRCRLSNYSVEIGPPLFWGPSYLFDGIRHVLTIRRHILKLPIVKTMEAAFEDVVVRMDSRDETLDRWLADKVRRTYYVEVEIRANLEGSRARRFEMCAVGREPDHAEVVISELERIGVPMSRAQFRRLLRREQESS